jgi:hypothetical protein
MATGTYSNVDIFDPAATGGLTDVWMDPKAYTEKNQFSGASINPLDYQTWVASDAPPGTLSEYDQALANAQEAWKSGLNTEWNTKQQEYLSSKAAQQQAAEAAKIAQQNQWAQNDFLSSQKSAEKNSLGAMQAAKKKANSLQYSGRQMSQGHEGWGL